MSSQLIALLRRLRDDEWQRRTIAGTWVVRDVVAHLVDLTFRRLSFHRDRMTPPPPPKPIASGQDFVGFINWLNAGWVDASKRFSPRVLTDLLEKGSADLADWFESVPMEAPALFGVSWAGEESSAGWFDIGREFTELWHHQEQIRIAVGAPSLQDPRYLHAVLEVAVRGLPHAWRDADAAEGQSVVIDVTGPAGGTWSLLREAQRWSIHEGAPPAGAPGARVRLSDDLLWKLLFNALPRDEASRSVHVEGNRALAEPLLNARSVIV